MNQVLFRKDYDSEEEFNICAKYFPTMAQRTLCSPGMIIGRYSVLPYYLELQRDVESRGCSLINSHTQHLWIANFSYYECMKGLTPESWDDSNFYLCAYDGPFVVKGKTNSKKMQWDKMMFAETKKDVLNISCELMADGLIGEQGVIYRKYVPLKTFEIGLNGLPFTDEWRFFFYKNHLLSHGYYWSTAEKTDYDIEPACIEFAKRVAIVASEHVNFFVLDVAKTEEGEWILIEINDGQMSGLSENDPHMLYSNLKKVLG